MQATCDIDQADQSAAPAFDDVAASLPRSIENAKRRHSALGYKSPVAFEEEHGRWPIEGLHVCPPRGVQLSVRGRPDIKRALIRGPLILSECPRLAVGAPERRVQQQIGQTAMLGPSARTKRLKSPSQPTNRRRCACLHTGGVTRWTTRSYPGPFREPGLNRAATGQARGLWGGPLGDAAVPTRGCDR